MLLLLPVSSQSGGTLWFEPLGWHWAEASCLGKHTQMCCCPPTLLCHSSLIWGMSMLHHRATWSWLERMLSKRTGAWTASRLVIDIHMTSPVFNATCRTWSDWRKFALTQLRQSLPDHLLKGKLYGAPNILMAGSQLTCVSIQQSVRKSQLGVMVWPWLGTWQEELECFHMTPQILGLLTNPHLVVHLDLICLRWPTWQWSTGRCL